MLLYLVWLTNLIAINCQQLLDQPPASPQIRYYEGSKIFINRSEDWLIFKEEMPYKYNILATPSENKRRIVRLECKSSNADSIKWEFRHSDDKEWGDVPSFFLQETAVVQDTSSTSLAQKSYNTNDFYTVNGSYRCVAKHTKKHYVTSSPHLRLIVAHAIEYPTSAYRNEEYNYKFDQGGPGKIPCKQERALIVPGDATRFFPEAIIHTEWRNRIQPKTRLRINYITGDLYMAYFKDNDAKPTFNGYYELRFELFTSSGITTVSKVDDIKISNTSVNAELKIVYPNYKQENGQLIALQDDVPTCIIGEQCYIQTIFSGRLGGDLPVRAVSPNGTIYNFPDDSTGFFLTAQSFNESGMYRVDLYHEGNSSAVKSLMLQVNIISYPQLLERASFSPKKYTKAGDDIFIGCKTNHTDNTSFYFNDERLTLNSFSNLRYSDGEDEFAITKIRRDQNAAVQCLAHGPAGKSFFNTLLVVYEKPVVILSPSGFLDISPNDLTNASSKTLTCSVRLDRTESGEIYWRWSGNDTQMGTSLRNFGNFSNVVQTQFTVVLNPDIINSSWWCEVKYKAEYTDNQPAIAGGAPLRFRVSFSAEPDIERSRLTSSQNEKNWNLVTVIVLAGVGGLIFVLAAIACVYLFMCIQTWTAIIVTIISYNKLLPTMNITTNQKERAAYVAENRRTQQRKAPIPVSYKGPVAEGSTKSKKNSTGAKNETHE